MNILWTWSLTIWEHQGAPAVNWAGVLTGAQTRLGFRPGLVTALPEKPEVDPTRLHPGCTPKFSDGQASGSQKITWEHPSWCLGSMEKGSEKALSKQWEINSMPLHNWSTNNLKTARCLNAFRMQQRFWQPIVTLTGNCSYNWHINNLIILASFCFHSPAAITPWKVFLCCPQTDLAPPQMVLQGYWEGSPVDKCLLFVCSTVVVFQICHFFIFFLSVSVSSISSWFLLFYLFLLHPLTKNLKSHSRISFYGQFHSKGQLTASSELQLIRSYSKPNISPNYTTQLHVTTQ
jgi:hypothetical protein